MAARSVSFAGRPDWSKDDSNWNYFPYSGALSTDGAGLARVWFDIEGITSDQLEIEAFFDVSNNGTDWTGAAKLGGVNMTKSANGFAIDDDYDNISAAIKGKRFLRVGIRAKNKSGTTSNELAWVSMGVDFTG